MKTEEKSNEITAIPQLLRLLDISGCIITIDAMGTQKKITQTIIKNHGDYVLALKKNHKELYYETVNGGHGRIETHKYTMASDIAWLQDKKKWTGLKSIGMVESIREINGECSNEKRYYISSLKCDAEKFGNAVRSHWVLDIAFREDESRIRKGSAPENFAAIRHIALNLLRNNKTFKGSVKTKRLNAAMFG